MSVHCKLCKSNPADKTNSHIVPKFLTKAILGNENPRVGHLLDTSKPFEKPPQSQDTPKEDYILCSECEKYFETLETYIAEKIVKRLGNLKYNSDFTFQDNGLGVNFAIGENVSPQLMKLFVYSIFWRCSISQLPLFGNFTLKPAEEEILRSYLLSYKKQDFKTLSEIINENDFPYVVLKPEQRDSDPTKNFLYANSANEDIYQIIANDYIFFISFMTNGRIATFDILVNKGSKKVHLGLLQTSMWESLRQGLYNHAAEIAIRNANKKSK